MKRRVLIVSPHFPPTNAPDHQRVRMSLPYFETNDWIPEVLAVDAKDVAAPNDARLSDTVPDHVPIHRVRAWSTQWTRCIGIGTLGYRAWVPIARRGAALLKTGRFDLVYFSTTQYLLTALGPIWRRKWGVPYVVDIQDPWRTDYYDQPGAPRPPGGWKYRFAHFQANQLEERAWRQAAGFISVSPRYLEDLGARYAWFQTKPTRVVPFGASAADFAIARSDSTVAPAFNREPGKFHLVSVGAIGPIMRAALTTLFAGLAELARTTPEVADRFRFHFVGTSYAPADRAVRTVMPLAEMSGVSRYIDEQPSRIGYFDALKTMLEADALVIPGSNDPSYSPSKAAACALAHRPTLALFPGGSIGAARIKTLGFAEIISPDEPTSPAAISAWLRHTLGGDATRQPICETNPRGDTAAELTREQCSLFDAALEAGHAKSGQILPDPTTFV